MRLHGIRIPEDRIGELCRRHHIRRLALSGSILRDDFSDDSDIDLLVEFEPSQPVGFLRLAAIELELTDLLGRKVDLSTVGSLSPYFRDQVLREASTLYVAA